MNRMSNLKSGIHSIHRQHAIPSSSRLPFSPLTVSSSSHLHLHPSLLGEFRTGRDSLGEVQIPAKALWQTTTQRSLSHLYINLPTDRIPYRFNIALALIKKAAVICSAQGYVPGRGEGSAGHDHHSLHSLESPHSKYECVTRFDCEAPLNPTSGVSGVEETGEETGRVSGDSDRGDSGRGDKTGVGAGVRTSPNVRTRGNGYIGYMSGSEGGEERDCRDGQKGEWYYPELLVAEREVNGVAVTYVVDPPVYATESAIHHKDSAYSPTDSDWSNRYPLRSSRASQGVVGVGLHSDSTKHHSLTKQHVLDGRGGYGILSVAKAVCIVLAADEVVGNSLCKYSWKRGDADLVLNYRGTVLDFIDRYLESTPIRTGDSSSPTPLDLHFPLSMWQTGSGTHSNMNVNEVIATRATEIARELGLTMSHDVILSHTNSDSTSSASPSSHSSSPSSNPPPSQGALVIDANNDVNICQSSNDTFPTAMHLVGVVDVINLYEAVAALRDTFLELKKQHAAARTIKLGRTHLRDATPITLAMELDVYATSLSAALHSLHSNLLSLSCLPIAGTAVGNGINTYQHFDAAVSHTLSLLCSVPLYSLRNKSYSMALHEPFVSFHHSLSSLASSLLKLCNDWRFYDSGPRGGISEYTIHPLEPGSSIMPGKTNPTQLESLAQVCIWIMGLDTSVQIGNSQGHCQLNAYNPMMGVLCSDNAKRLTESLHLFNEYCVKELRFNTDEMRRNVDDSLMLVTQLNQAIGYQYGTTIAKYCYAKGLTLREVLIDRLRIFSSTDEYDRVMRPEAMTELELVDIDVLHQRVLEKTRSKSKSGHDGQGGGSQGSQGGVRVHDEAKAMLEDMKRELDSLNHQ